MKKQDFITKIHLVISVLVVVPVSILYAFSPDSLLELYPQNRE